MPDKLVLFADNDRDFLNTRAEFLEDEDYRVLPAYGLDQAREFLAKARVHLAILDIRLVDDDDERDTSGLTLAKEPAFRAVPKIILTSFPTYQTVREALGLAGEGLPPAVNFLAKQEGPEAMLQSVAETFDRNVRLNWDLNLRYGEQLSTLHLVNLIEPELATDFLADRTGTLEDLFRRLFFESTEVNFNRLLVRRAGRVFLSAFAYPKTGGATQFVVACGRSQLLTQENTHYENFVPAASSQGMTVKDKTAATVQFVANSYTLIGGDLEEMKTFSEFYRARPIEIILPVLDHLFSQTLSPWYRSGRFETEEKSVNELCREWLAWNGNAFASEELGNRIQSLCSEALASGLPRIDYSPTRLTFQLGDVSYPNPIPELFEKQINSDEPVLCGITHGQLNGDSVLVDARGRTWLIDFSKVGPAPLLCDLVSLETAIKFELLAGANLADRLDLEQRLLDLPGLSAAADPEGLELELQKALKSICRIRQLAAEVIGSDDKSYRTYQIGLLYCAVARLANFDPRVRYTRGQLVPQLYSLLAAALICQDLTPKPRTDLLPEARDSLWIDEANRQVWVEGRQISLTRQQFKLLLYLSQHQGQLCKYSVIAERVFDATFESGLSEADKRRMEESRINSTISRLRRRLEPDPSNPKYIVTVRGEGYRLELSNR